MATPDLHDQLLFVAETVGQLSERFDKIEHENTAASQSVRAARELFDGTRQALEAALTGIKALNFHVLENNLGGVSSRLSEVEKQADTAIKALEKQLADASARLSAAIGETTKRLESADAQRTELSQKREADAQTFEQRFQKVGGDLAAIKNLLLEQIEAARKEFAEPATLNPAGKFEPNRIYRRLDLIEYNGSSYVSTVDNNSEIPGAKAKNWQTIARRGASPANGGGSTIEPASLQTLTAGATITWDLLNPVASVTLGAAANAFTFRNGRAGGTYVIALKQDSIGSRTVTWPSAVVWQGGVAPTLTTTASKVDVAYFVYDGTVYYGSIGQNYAAA